jgi:hypothetical protein
LHNKPTATTFQQVVNLLNMCRELRNVFLGIEMDNTKRLHSLPTVLLVLVIVIVIINERFEINVPTDHITDDIKITPIERYILPTPDNLICQSMGRVGQSEVIWLMMMMILGILGTIPDLDLVDIAYSSIAFFSEWTDGVEHQQKGE